jgi:tetratricopeptide (TPR) repeat protein
MPGFLLFKVIYVVKFTNSPTPSLYGQTSEQYKTSMRLKLILGLFRKGQTQTAHDRLENIPDTYRGDFWWLLKVQCLLNLSQNPEEALNLLERHIQNKSFPRYHYCRAMCLQKMGKYQMAHGILTGIQNWQLTIDYKLAVIDCTHALILRASTLQKSGRYQEAIETISNAPGWHENRKLVIQLAVIHKALRNFDEALIVLNQLPQDSEKLCEIAICYIEMGCLHQGIEAYRRIPDWESDPQVLALIANAFALGGNTGEAIKTLKMIPEWYRSKEVLFAMGRYYASSKQYDMAHLMIDKVCKDVDRREQLLERAFCYESSGYFLDALATLISINNWQSDRQVLLAFGRVYEAYGNYSSAISTLLKIENSWNDPEVLTLIANCNRHAGNLSVARQIYCQVIANFPDYLPGMLEYCYSLLCYDLASAPQQLSHAIEKWPMIAQFRLMLADVYWKTGKFDRVASELHAVLEQFPYDIQTHLQSIQFYIARGDVEQVRNLQFACAEKFRGNISLFDQIGRMIADSGIIPKESAASTLVISSTGYSIFKLENLRDDSRLARGETLSDQADLAVLN